MIDEKKLIEELKKGQLRIQDKIGNTAVSAISETIDLVIEEINRQPKADWIPCEVELPKKHDEYLATIKKTSDGKVEYFTTIDVFNPQTKVWYMNIDIPNLKREIIAWQPKLQPYERMTVREDKCLYEKPFPRGNDYICKKTGLICTAEKLKFCKKRQPYKKEGAE